MDYLEILDKEDVKGLEDYLETHDANEEMQNQNSSPFGGSFSDFKFC